MYVENRVEHIRKSTMPSQWNYVPTSINPADIGTRSVSLDDLSCSSWIQGPGRFLDRQQNIDDQEDYSSFVDSESDKDVRPLVSVVKTSIKDMVMTFNKDFSSRFDKFSDWNRFVKYFIIIGSFHRRTRLAPSRRTAEQS